MISDFLATLQDNGSPTNLAGTEPRLSADSIDLLTNKNIGAGRLLRAVFVVTTTIVANASSTGISFEIIACTDDAGSNPVVVASTGFIAKALLTGGSRFEAKANQFIGGALANRFLKMRVSSNDGADMASGAAVAKLVTDVDSGETYPSGFAVL